MSAEIKLKQVDGGGPQGRHSDFFALAENGDGSVREVKPGGASVRGLLGSGAGVVEESEDGQVAESVGR